MIFKNLTIVLIAYGEFLWFGGSQVTGLTLLSFGLMVASSMIAFWADLQHASSKDKETPGADVEAVGILNAGYLWMLSNCLSNAVFLLGMKKRIKTTGFKDFDSTHFTYLSSFI